MKNVLPMVALCLIYSNLAYAMEKKEQQKESSPTCTTCGIKIGRCDWGALAVNLATIHTGPIQPEIDQSLFPKQHHPEAAPDVKNGAVSDDSKAAEASLNQAADDDWDKISDDWEDVANDHNQNKK